MKSETNQAGTRDNRAKPPATTGRQARKRVTGAVYHAGVGLLTLAPGVGALTAGSRGMSTTASAAMDDPAVAPSAVGLRVDFAVTPTTPSPNAPVTFSYHLIDTRNGRTISTLPLEHERPMHLIVVSRGLTRFQHIHPRGNPLGIWQVRTTLGVAGTYILYDEFSHAGRTVVDRRVVVIGRPSGGGGAQPGPGGQEGRRHDRHARRARDHQRR
jgi:hypothetical protein